VPASGNGGERTHKDIPHAIDVKKRSNKTLKTLKNVKNVTKIKKTFVNVTKIVTSS